MEIDGKLYAREGADNFRAEGYEVGQEVVVVSAEAQEVARILEGPANPSNPRYENLELGPIRDALIRVESGQQFEIEVVDFTGAVDAGRTYLDARREEIDAKSRKDNAAAFLVGLARRIPNFRGIGFPDDNSSATVVTVKSKSVPDEKVGELVESAGSQLHEFATEQIQLTVNVPVSLIDRKGKQLSAEELEKRLDRYLKRMMRPEDKGLFSITRKLKVHNWKKLAQLIREGKVSPDLVNASEDFVVKPIALSQIPEKKSDTSQE